MAWYDFLDFLWIAPGEHDKPITVGPDVLPGGAYTPVEALPEYYWAEPIITRPDIPFNPDDTDLTRLYENRDDTIDEEAKENPNPTVLSRGFVTLYNGMMKACIADQTHRYCNPNATSACRDFAASGDVRELILNAKQKEALGVKIPPSQENKSDEVRKREDKDPSIWSNFATGVRSGYNLEPKPGGDVGTPEGERNIFQESLTKWAGQLTGLANTPNYATALVVGGAFILLLLVIKK